MNYKTIISILLIAFVLKVALAADGACATGQVAGKAVLTCATDTTVQSCKPGYYKKGDNECAPCAAGKMTSGTDDTTTTTACSGTCTANFYCPLNTVAADADNKTACPANKGSPAGSAADTDCVSCGTGASACTVTGTGASQTIAITTCQDGYIKKTSGTPAVVSCVTPTVKGCKTGTSDGTTETCTACGTAKSGYSPKAPASNACTACTTAGCGTCTDATPEVCSACKDGFYKTTDATFTCKACATGCLTCPDGADGATKCSTVDKGYKLSAAAPATPTACTGTDGKTSESTTSLNCDVACTDANCLDCLKDKAKCVACKDNFEVQADGTCKAFTAIHATCNAANKPDSADNCLSCKAADNRTIEMDTTATPAVAKKVGKCLCKDGFVDVSTASAVKAACEACGAGVKTCDAAKQALTCTNSAELPVGTVCKAKGATDAEGFYYDSVNSVFKGCHATCVTCTGAAATQCTKCYDAPASWVEPTSLAANYPTYIKGTRALINSTCFSECPSGFIANSARNSCVAGAAAGGTTGSASGVFAVLSLIASLFLIF